MTDGLCQCGCGGITPIAKHTNPSKGHTRGHHVRYIAGHNRRKSPVEYLVDPVTGCWVWQKARNQYGYGVMRYGGRARLAHRIYYEKHMGQIPKGLEIDHLCRNRACVNPAHLEAVTASVNITRAWAARKKAACL